MKSIKSFPTDKSKPDGFYSSCRKCHAKQYREHPEKKLRNRIVDLKRKYGLTMQEYTEMKEKQNGRCAICGGINKTGWNLAVDHNHKTGKIRGLLCSACNLVVGASQESPEILALTIKYLEEYNG